MTVEYTLASDSGAIAWKWFRPLASPLPHSRDTINTLRLERRCHMGTKKTKSKQSSNGNRSRNGGFRPKLNTADLRTYSIPALRLEHPDLTVRQVTAKDKDGAEHIRYEVEGNLNAPVPPIRDSKYLDQKQCIEVYRYMLLNRKMKVALENLYKHRKLVTRVYFTLRQQTTPL